MGGINSIIAEGIQQPKPANPFADIAQIMQLKQAQKLLPLKIQEAQQNAQKNALELQETQRQIADRDNIRKSYAAAIVTDPTTGLPTTDLGKLTSAMATNGVAEQIPAATDAITKVKKASADLQEAQQKIKDKQNEYAAGFGTFIKANGYNPDLYREQLKTAVANKDTSQQNAGQILQQLDQLDQQDPTGKLAQQFTQQHADAMIAMGGPAFTTAQARQAAADTGAKKLPGELAAQARAAELAPDVARKAAADADIAEQNANKPAVERNPTEASLAFAVARGKAPGASPEQVAAGQAADAALKRLDASKLAARPITNISMTPGQEDTTAQLIAAGKMDPATARAILRRNPGLYSQVSAIDPQFDEAQLDKRYQTAKEFGNTSNSKAGGQVNALNTVIHHADLYLDTADALKNGSFVPGNAAYNAVSAMMGSPAPSNANLVARFLAGETGKVATGGVPAEGEINGILSSLGQNASPEQMHQAGQKLLQIAAGRMIPLQERLTDAKLDKVYQVLGPDAKAILQKRGIDPATMKPISQTGGAQAPAVGTVKGGYKFKGGNPADQKNWEKQ